MKVRPPTRPFTLRSPGAAAALALLLLTTAASAYANPVCTHPTGGVPFGLMGDINGSGTRNVADALCATMAALVSLATAEGEPPWPSCVQVDPLLLDLNPNFAKRLPARTRAFRLRRPARLQPSAVSRQQFQ